jgi:hypothetical protein
LLISTSNRIRHRTDRRGVGGVWIILSEEFCEVATEIIVGNNSLSVRIGGTGRGRAGRGREGFEVKTLRTFEKEKPFPQIFLPFLNGERERERSQQ